jgi:hypothetical protein
MIVQYLKSDSTSACLLVHITKCEMWAEQIEAIFCIPRKVVVGLSSQHYWQEGQKISIFSARQKKGGVFYFSQKSRGGGSENQFAAICRYFLVWFSTHLNK